MNDQPEGSVALLAAANAGDSEFVSFLLDRGASIESHSITSAPVTNGEHIVDATDLAADRDELVKTVLGERGGSDPNARDRQRMTPLMYAAGAIQTGEDLTPVIQALIAAKADIDRRATNGDTALDLADRFGKSRSLRRRKATRRARPGNIR